MSRCLTIIAVCAASLGACASSASAGYYVPSTATPDVALHGYFDTGGQLCTFDFQYGNFWTAAYAKVRLTSFGCFFGGTNQMGGGSLRLSV